MELREAKGLYETTKGKMCEQLGWDGEEAYLAENVANYCRTYLFLCYKFLKDKGVHRLPAHIYGFSGGKKKHQALFPATTEQNITLVNFLRNLAFQHI